MRAAMARTVLAPGVGSRVADLDNFARLEDLAEQICAHLGAGWHLVPQTLRDGSPVEHIPWVATISDHEMVVQLMRRAGEPRTEASFGQLHDDLGRLVSHGGPRITFDAQRGPEPIARDLRRRLLDPGRVWWEAQRDRQEVVNGEHWQRQETAERLAQLGFESYGCRQDVPMLSLPPGRLRCGVRSVRVEVRAADAVRMELELSPLAALEVGACVGHGSAPEGGRGTGPDHEEGER